MDNKRFSLTGSIPSSPIKTNNIESVYDTSNRQKYNTSRTLNYKKTINLQINSQYEQPAKTRKLLEPIITVYENLDRVVDTLDEKLLDNAMKTQDSLLAAYRYKFTEIQKELAKLKSELTDEKVKMRRDKIIVSLEEERDWYREELLKADSKLKKVDAENKALQAELDEAVKDKAIFYEEIFVLKKKLKSIMMFGLEKSVKEEDVQGQYETQKLPEYECKPQCEKDYDNIVVSLQNQLRTQKKLVQNLKVDRMIEYNKDYELKEFFMSCVEEVKKSISSRKHTATFSSRNKNEYINQYVQTTKSTTDFEASKVALGCFLSTDKKKVMDLMFSKNEFIELLVQLVFPVKDPSRYNCPVKNLLTDSEKLAPNSKTINLEKLPVKKRIRHRQLKTAKSGKKTII